MGERRRFEGPTHTMLRAEGGDVGGDCGGVFERGREVAAGLYGLITSEPYGSAIVYNM